MNMNFAIIFLLFSSLQSNGQIDTKEKYFLCECADSSSWLQLTLVENQDGKYLYTFKNHFEVIGKVVIQKVGDAVYLLRSELETSGVLLASYNYTDKEYRTIGFHSLFGLKIMSVDNIIQSKGGATAHSAYISQLVLTRTGQVEELQFFDGLRNYKCESQ